MIFTRYLANCSFIPVINPSHSHGVKKMFMKYQFHVPVVLLVCLLLVVPALTAPACQSLPVSVSEITQCKNGMCSANVVAAATLSFKSGATTTCLDLVADNEKIATMNITLVNSYSSQSFESCYYTDDAKYQITAACSCAADATWSASCPDCSRAILYLTDYVFCGTASHQDRVCLISSGNHRYCYKIGFKKGTRRYKVCGLKAKNPPKATMKIETEKQTLYVNFDQKAPVYITDDKLINFTVTQFSFDPISDLDYIVLNFNNTDDFWVSGSDLVNSMADYNFFKIGWMKVDRPLVIPDNIINQVSITMESCGTSADKAVYGRQLFAVDPIDIMKSHPNRYAAKSLPGAFVQDDEWLTAISSKVNAHSGIGDAMYWELTDGFFGYQYLRSSSMSFVGLGTYDNYVPTRYKTLTSPLNLRTNKGRTVSGLWNLHCSQAWLGTKKSNYCGEVCVAELPTGGLEYGFCYKNNCDDASMAYICDNFDVSALNWPSSQWVQYTFQDRMVITWPELDDSNSALFYANTEATLTYTLSMKNVSIRFTSEEVKPTIISCTADGADVRIKLKSTGADGTVMVTCTPGLFPTKLWYITNVEHTKEYPLERNATGLYTFFVRNSDYTTSCQVELNYTIIPDYGLNQTKPGGNPGGSGSNGGGFLDWLNSLFRIPTGGSLFSDIVFWVVVVLVVVIGVV